MLKINWNAVCFIYNILKYVISFGVEHFRPVDFPDGSFFRTNSYAFHDTSHEDVVLPQYAPNDLG